MPMRTYFSLRFIRKNINSFARQVLVSVVSIFIASTLLVGISLLLFKPEQPKITDKTVLKIVLRGKVVERVPSTLLREQTPTIDLTALRDAIKQAKTDRNIRGIYLEVDALEAGWASLEEIKHALSAFQKAGKFIIAYGTNYTQKTYYVASLADEIILHPEGIFPLKGLSQTVFFYQELLKKLSITPEIFRVGQYKSAIEPFIRQNMSEESKQQSSSLLHTIHGHFLNGIAKARNLKQAHIQAMENTLSAVIPNDAYKAQLVSQLGYFDDAETHIKTRIALEEETTINYVPFTQYVSHNKKGRKINMRSSKRQIAVVIADGVIVDGKSTYDTIGALDLASSLRTIRKDKTIKAVVLRINSPGGSALASDTLWKELMLLKSEKPVVASLADIAASGGYYLAAACDRIVAHPTTITGSIGIFALLFDVHALLNQKLGITTDVVKTSSSADLLTNPGRPLKSSEKIVIQKLIDKGYNTFLERVATGRKMDKQAVAHLASGRVWAGQLAQEKGLVDELGDLEAAIQTAAKLTDIEKDYTLTYWPKPPALSEQIFRSWTHVVNNKPMLMQLQTSAPAVQHIQRLTHMTGIQACLPYMIEIE